MLQQVIVLALVILPFNGTLIAQWSYQKLNIDSLLVEIQKSKDKDDFDTEFKHKKN